MAIGLRGENTGVGRVIVVWVHYGEDVADPGEGLAVWVQDGEPDPFEDTTFFVEFPPPRLPVHNVITGVPIRSQSPSRPRASEGTLHIFA
jgi:hypothetical protein